MRFWKRTRRNDDFRAEIEAHLALEADALAAQQGLTERDAEDAARRAFGNVAATQEAFHERARWLWLERFGRNLRYTARSLKRHPGFGIAIVATLAIGIGLNVALFTFLYGFMLRPFPVRDAGRVVNVYQQLRGRGMREVHGTTSFMSYPEFLAYTGGVNVFSAAAVYAEVELSLANSPRGRTRGQEVSCDYFRTLDVRVTLGRPFTRDECASAGVASVAVLSNAMWRSTFGADSSLIGRTVRLNNLPFVVIGVTEPGFGGVMPQSADVWVPITMQPALSHGRDSLLIRPNVSWLMVVARLAPGVTAERARAQLATIAARPDPDFPQRIRRPIVVPGSYFNFPEVRKEGGAGLALILVLGATIVAMSCANVASLLLARGLARRREVGIRLAIGASRWRLIEQLLVESLVLALMGALLGMALVLAMPAVVRALAPVDALQVNVGPDLRIVGYAFVIAIGTALLAGLVPALQTTNVDLVSSFKGSVMLGRRQMRPSRFRASVVGIQVAASALLIVIACTVFRAAARGSQLDPGYAVRNVVAFDMNLEDLGYDQARARLLYDALEERLRATPGVVDVAVANNLPLLGRNTETLEVPSESGGAPESPTVNVNTASGSYLSTMDIPILRGRTFATADLTADDRPAVVSESMERSVWHGSSSLGKRFKAAGHWYNVVGVSREARTSSFADAESPTAYLASMGPLGREMIVRTSGPSVSVIAAMTKWTHDMDPEVVLRAERFEDRIGLVLKPTQLIAAMTGTLGTVALLLAGVGIAGVVSFGVSQRSREVAIRMALGATPRGVVALMMKQGTRPILGGLMVGAMLAVGIGFVLRSFLFGISPGDPIALAVALGVLLAGAGAATYLPSRRAARVDPALTLRSDG